MAVWRKQTNKQNTKTGDNLPLTGGIRLWCFNTEHDITSKVIDRFTKTNPFQKAKKSVYAYQKQKIKILCKNSNEKAPKEQVTRKKTLKYINEKKITSKNKFKNLKLPFLDIYLQYLIVKFESSK